MQYGSVGGQALFPLAILAVKQSDTAAAQMETYRQRVPLKMFLPWVTQLISHVSSASAAIGQLLLDLADQYPTHVRLPFSITKQVRGQDVLELNVVRELESKLLVDSTWKHFLDSIGYLLPPEKAVEELFSVLKESGII